MAEVFHRAIEGSRISILKKPSRRPKLGPDRNTFRMVDLLPFAFERGAALLNPLADRGGPNIRRSVLTQVEGRE